jgi:hypothetical protein
LSSTSIALIDPGPPPRTRVVSVLAHAITIRWSVATTGLTASTFA